MNVGHSSVIRILGQHRKSRFNENRDRWQENFPEGLTIRRRIAAASKVQRVTVKSFSAVADKREKY
jgi:hypothetical protein